MSIFLFGYLRRCHISFRLKRSAQPTLVVEISAKEHGEFDTGIKLVQMFVFGIGGREDVMKLILREIPFIVLWDMNEC